MRVLVTGAAGFVGYAVAALLVEHGHQVMGLTRSQASALPTGVQRMHGDLCRPQALPQALADINAVCHLAGLTKVRESRTDPLDYWRTNVGGTLAILDKLASAPGGRVVLASTCAVYGEQAEQPISETAAVAPTSPYGTSKLAADQAAADRSDRSDQPARLQRRRSPTRTPRPRHDSAHSPTPRRPTRSGA
jgi:UDP-glucose 4-epimerase